MTCFSIHFFLVLTVSCNETFWLLGHGLTLFPSVADSFWQKAETFTSAALGQQLRAPNPLRQGVVVYTNLTGIEAGYGFFAPNVPDSYKLIFELRYADNSVGYELLSTGGSESDLRLASLLDEIGRTQNPALRDVIVKMLVRATWRKHPTATTIRALFGSMSFPSPTEFNQGAAQSFRLLYAYDFSLSKRPTQHKKP